MLKYILKIVDNFPCIIFFAVVASTYKTKCN
jgi:hypothetical protein